MTHEYKVQRYGAYFRGWCQAFGEHDSILNEETGLSWLISQHQVGFLLQPEINKLLQKELLRQQSTPTLSISKEQVQLGPHHYALAGEADRKSYAAIEKLFGQNKNYHLYLTSHFRYGTEARILTLSNVEPLYILYKRIGDMVIQLD